MGAGFATCSGTSTVAVQDNKAHRDLGFPAPELSPHPKASQDLSRQLQAVRRTRGPRQVTDSNGNVPKRCPAPGSPGRNWSSSDSGSGGESQFRAEVDGLFSPRTPRSARPKSARGHRQGAHYKKNIFSVREFKATEAPVKEDAEETSLGFLSERDSLLSIPDETKSPRRQVYPRHNDSIEFRTCKTVDNDDWWTGLPGLENGDISSRSQDSNSFILSRAHDGGGGSCVSKKASERSISSVLLIPSIDFSSSHTNTLPSVDHPVSDIHNGTFINNAPSPRNYVQKEPLTSSSLSGSTPTDNSTAANSNNSKIQQLETSGKLGETVISSMRPDSGIAVSSCASYSDEAPREKDVDEVSTPMDWITTSLEMLQTILLVQTEQHTSVKSLVQAITTDCKSEQLKAHALYRWLTSQKLDYYKNTTDPKATVPTKKLQQLAEGNLTYASLYQEMTRAAGLRCEIIDGLAKSQHYKPGSSLSSPANQHSWNAVVINDHYTLIDAHFGSLPYKFFVEHFFMTPPDEFRLSHFPKDKKWLLMTQGMSEDDFRGILKTWPAMFAFNIRPLNMSSVLKSYDGRLSITILLCNVAVTPMLEYEGPGQPIDSDTLAFNIDQEIRSEDNAETFHMRLPQEGNYYFTLLVHDHEEGEDIPALQYKVEYMDELL